MARERRAMRRSKRSDGSERRVIRTLTTEMREEWVVYMRGKYEISEGWNEKEGQWQRAKVVRETKEE